MRKGVIREHLREFIAGVFLCNKIKLNDTIITHIYNKFFLFVIYPINNSQSLIYSRFSRIQYHILYTMNDDIRNYLIHYMLLPSLRCSYEYHQWFGVSKSTTLSFIINAIARISSCVRNRPPTISVMNLRYISSWVMCADSV